MSEDTQVRGEIVGGITITTVNGTPEERAVIDMFREMRKQYKVPILTEYIQIETGAIPHSHPILTINERPREPDVLLELVSHEQMHWFFQAHAQRDDALAYLKARYEDLGDCNKSGKYPDSFWEHIGVIWNTIAILRSQLTEQNVRWLFGGPHNAYPLTTSLVFEEYVKINSELKRFEMVYDLNELR